MSEDPQAPGPVEPGAGADAPEPVRTGVESVDAVIAAVEALEERQKEEHVGVFESAQAQLRRALDTQQPTPPAPQPPADRSQSS